MVTSLPLSFTCRWLTTMHANKELQLNHALRPCYLDRLQSVFNFPVQQKHQQESFSVLLLLLLPPSREFDYIENGISISNQASIIHQTQTLHTPTINYSQSLPQCQSSKCLQKEDRKRDGQRMCSMVSINGWPIKGNNESP